MALLRDALSVSDGVPLLVVRRRPHRTVIVARKDFAAQPRALLPEEDRSAPPVTRRMSAITASSSETKINPPSEVTIYHLEPPYDQEPVLVLKDTDLRSIGWIDADTLLLENISTFETSGGIESDSFLGGSAACVRTPGISTEILSCATGIFSAGGAAEGPVLSRVEGSIRSYSKAIASWTFVS